MDLDQVRESIKGAQVESDFGWLEEITFELLDEVERLDPEPGRLTAEEGQRICREVAAHPKRVLIEEIAETTFDLNNEHDATGGGMWFHLSQAYCLVEALPGLQLAESIGDQVEVAGIRFTRIGDNPFGETP